MADPHWTSYIGMITGISGAIMGFISYRRSNKLKVLDFRLELRKSLNDLYLDHENAESLIAQANKSRRAVASAAGSFGSGRMQIWDANVRMDTEKLETIKQYFPEKDEKFSDSCAEALESKLVEIHSFRSSILLLLNKYKEEMEIDNEERLRIRSERSARHGA